MEKFSNYLFIACLCLTILGEFLLAMYQLICSISDWIKKEKRDEFQPAAEIWKKSVLLLVQSSSKKVKSKVKVVPKENSEGAKLMTGKRLSNNMVYAKTLKKGTSGDSVDMKMENLSKKSPSSTPNNEEPNQQFVKKRITGTESARKILMKKKKRVLK